MRPRILLQRCISFPPVAFIASSTISHNRRRQILCVGVAFWAWLLCSGQVPPAGGQEDTPPLGTWQTAAPAPTKRTEVTASALGGKIYLIGGFAEPSLGNLRSLAITDAVEVYDPATDRWTTISPLPGKVHHAGSAVIANKLYVVGGFTRSFFSVWRPIASLYIYDPEADAWTEGPPMPTPRGALAAAELDGKLYAIGGYDGNANSGAVEVYDPSTNRWTIKTPLPTPRDHLAAVAVQNRLYAFGGRLNRDYGRNLAVAEAYDPAADRWATVKELPTPRSGITAAAMFDTIYVIGGEAPQGTFSTNEAYFPDSDRWQTMAPMPTARHGLGSAVVGGRLYVLAGGPRPGGSFSNANEVFIPPKRAGAPPHDLMPARRAAPQLVGAVMALLATFDDAGVLPPESSPEANRLIKALIQFQSAFMKSADAGVRRWFTEAIEAKFGAQSSDAVARFRTNGWTSESLEAVVDYAAVHSVWDRDGLEQGFREFNVGKADWELLTRIFRSARERLAANGKDLHGTYAAKRREMPGS